MTTYYRSKNNEEWFIVGVPEVGEVFVLPFSSEENREVAWASLQEEPEPGEVFA